MLVSTLSPKRPISSLLSTSGSQTPISRPSEAQLAVLILIGAKEIPRLDVPKASQLLADLCLQCTYLFVSAEHHVILVTHPRKTCSLLGLISTHNFLEER